MRILLVEDDIALGSALEKALQLHHFNVVWVKTLKEASLQIEYQTLGLVLLDLTLPDGDGLTWLKQIKKGEHAKTPVIIMTARDQIEDRIEGLNLGADDYQAKPFNTLELIARIHAVYRRSQSTPLSVLEVGPLKLSIQTHEAWWQDTPIILAKKEYDLLQFLAEHPTQVFSKQQLEDKLYDFQTEIGSNTIEVHVHNLRKKTNQNFIKNLRGVGYKLNQNYGAEPEKNT